jgi:glycosyltransferase involved in cell wall biosynthesis
VAMLTYSFYEADGRVRRYAETLARRGDHVDVLSLRQEGQDRFENIRGVNVYRIQKRERNEKGKFSFLGRLLKFFITSFVFVTWRHLKAHYDLIHVHSVPDFEVFAAWLPRLSGTKIILDIHDIVPELYASKFGNGKNSLLFNGLLFLEKRSANFAHHVIISNHMWEKTLVNRSVSREKCSTVMNYPDPSLFHLRPRGERNGKVVLIYPGTLNSHQGVDIAVKAFDRIKVEAPEAVFHIYGAGWQKEYLAALIDQLGLRDRVLMKDFLPLDKIVKVMAAADIGVVPKKNDSFGGEAFSTKILEFMSLGVPVIVSRTKIDNYYFNDSVVKFFTPEDIDDLADSMLKMIRDQGLRKSLAENGLKFSKDFSWETRKGEYLSLVDRLLGK